MGDEIDGPEDGAPDQNVDTPDQERHDLDEEPRDQEVPDRDIEPPERNADRETPAEKAEREYNEAAERNDIPGMAKAKDDMERELSKPD